MQNAKKRMPITTIDLDLTNNCILACDYCFRGAKNPRRLSLETGKAAMDWFIRQSQNQKKLSVALFGGEPLMEFELIKQLVPYAKEKAASAGKDIHFSATTNCVLINDEMIDFFRKYKMTFHTSIDGGPESHDKHRKFPNGKGTSEIVARNVKKVLKYWPNRTARMTVCNDNIRRWMEDTQYLVELGYKNLAMIPVPEQEWTEEQFAIMKQQLRKISDFYIEQYRKKNPIYIKHLDGALKGIASPFRRKAHCGAGRGYVLVKTDGTIYPCHRFGGDIDADSKQEWKLGSIYDGWNEERRDNLLSFDCRKHVKADCENCIAVHTCGTTCIAVSWSCFHDIYKPHPNQCRFTKMYFEEAMRVHYILESENNVLFIQKYHPSKKNNPQSGGRAAPGKAGVPGSRPGKTASFTKAVNTRTGSRRPVGTPGSRPLIMVMVSLTGDYVSPCYIYTGHCCTQDKISVKQLRELFAWAAQQKPVMPQLFFMAGYTPLDSEIESAIKEMADDIILPFMPLEKQEALNIPYSSKQIVASNSLMDYLIHKDHLKGRILILHVNKEEIGRLSAALKANTEQLSRVLIRPKDIHAFTDTDLDNYKAELKKLAVLSLEKNSTSDFDKFNILNLNLATDMNGQFPYCLVNKGIIVYGADGLLYACPSSKDVKQSAIGRLDEKDKLDSYLRGSGNSTLCNCHVLEPKCQEGDSLHKIHKIEKEVRMNLLEQIANSERLYGYYQRLFSKMH